MPVKPAARRLTCRRKLASARRLWHLSGCCSRAQVSAQLRPTPGSVDSRLATKYSLAMRSCVVSKSLQRRRFGTSRRSWLNANAASHDGVLSNTAQAGLANARKIASPAYASEYTEW